MRTILFFLLLHFSSIIAAQQRLNVFPLFQRTITHAENKVFDTKAWSVYTGSPVRATLRFSYQYVYTNT